MKRVLCLLAFTLLFLMTLQSQNESSNCENVDYILARLYKNYDPHGNWSKSTIKLQLGEPRVGNPGRNSSVLLDNSNNQFEISRFTENGIIKTVVDEKNSVEMIFEGHTQIPDTILIKYGLTVERALITKRFYQLLYGLPMSFNDSALGEIEIDGIEKIGDKLAHRLKVNLREELIGQQWIMLVETKTYNLIALEFNHIDNSSVDEIIEFNGIVEFNGLKMPRTRTWKIKQSEEYLGTDVIIGIN